MGYIPNSDFSWISYQKRGWNDPHLVGYMESHDEERLMFKNVTYGTSKDDYITKDTTTALRRMAQVANFFFTIPGPKMLWQFGEQGYDYSIDYNGRTGEKPIRWDYLDDWKRRNLYHIYSELIRLKMEHEVFRTTDFDLALSGADKRIKLNGEDMKVVVLGNFDITAGSIDPDFYSTGIWYEFWTGDFLAVTDVNAEIDLAPGEYRLYTDKKLDSPDFVGIGENQVEQIVSDFIVYPNPASNAAIVSLHASRSAELRVEMYDITGKLIRVVHDGQIKSSIKEISLDVRDLQKGLYFLSIQGNNGYRKTSKLMVN